MVICTNGKCSSNRSRAGLGGSGGPRDRAIQPRFGQSLAAVGSGSRYLEDLRGLLESQAGEVTQFNHAGHGRAVFREPIQRLVEQQKLVGVGREAVAGLIKGNILDVLSAPLERGPLTGPVHQDLAHDFRGQGEEVLAIAKRPVRPFRQADVGLVNEGRGLERGAHRRSTQIGLGYAMQFAVEQAAGGVKRGRIALSPEFKKLRDIGAERVRHRPILSEGRNVGVTGVLPIGIVPPRAVRRLSGYGHTYLSQFQLKIIIEHFLFNHTGKSIVIVLFCRFGPVFELILGVESYAIAC